MLRQGDTETGRQGEFGNIGQNEFIERYSRLVVDLSWRLTCEEFHHSFDSESRWHRDSDILILTIAHLIGQRITPAANCGVSDLGDEIYLKGVTPECFDRGSSSEPRLDSRLKHAGMTDFE
jgi:hypothetical protein